MTFQKGRFSVVCIVWFTVCQFLLGVAPAWAQATDEGFFADVEPPLIEHEVGGEFDSDIEQTFVAVVVDDEQLNSVRLFYRFENQLTFNSAVMNRVSFSSTYIVRVPTDPASGLDIQYYIQASDLSGNRTVRGFAFSPLLRLINAPAVEQDNALIAEQAPVSSTTAQSTGNVPETSSRSRVVYYILGALAVGAIAAAASGGGGGSDGGTGSGGCSDGRCDVSITIDQPRLQ